MQYQQTWIITFRSVLDEAVDQSNVLEEFLLRASPDIHVAQKPRNDYAQGGWTDILVTVFTSGAAVAIVNAITTWIKSTHEAAIDIEIKGTKVKAQNVTNRNYEETLRELLKYAQESGNETEHGEK